MQEYEDGLCDGCGQPLRDSLDGDLLHEWATLDPVRCGSCTALAQARDTAEKAKVDHIGALRWVVGLTHGWQERRSAARAARATPQPPGTGRKHQHHA